MKARFHHLLIGVAIVALALWVVPSRLSFAGEKKGDKKRVERKEGKAKKSEHEGGILSFLGLRSKAKKEGHREGAEKGERARIAKKSAKDDDEDDEEEGDEKGEKGERKAMKGERGEKGERARIAKKSAKDEDEDDEEEGDEKSEKGERKAMKGERGEKGERARIAKKSAKDDDEDDEEEGDEKGEKGERKAIKNEKKAGKTEKKEMKGEKAKGKEPEPEATQEERVTLDQVPTVVRRALERECKGATIRDIVKETAGGKVLYDFEVTREGKAFEFDITADGEVVSREEQIDLSQAPAAVRQTIERASKGGKIGTIMRVNEEGKTSYEVEVAIEGKTIEIAIAADGKVITEAAGKEEGKEKEAAQAAQEEKVTLDQVPAAVRKTLERECPGATIRDIAKESAGEKTLYDFEVTREGRAFEFDIAANGEVLSREEQVELSQVSAAVRRTIERACKGGKIGTIMRVNEEGKTSYEAEVTIEGKTVEIAIAADGKVITEAADKEERAKGDKGGSGEWMDSFDVDKADLASTGKNPFFSLEPDYVLKFKEKDGAELTITVLNETKTVDGVETRVIEERETKDGQLAEVSLNWFAISKKTGNVYYFGEDSKEYKDGKVVSQSGSWESGKGGARFGMIMPGKPEVGQKYYQEVAPKTALDRAENVSLSETLEVPAGTFKNCLKTEESSALESGKEYKIYAPGVGLLKDGDFMLVSYGFEKEKGEKGGKEVEKPRGGKKGKSKKSE